MRAKSALCLVATVVLIGSVAGCGTPGPTPLPSTTPLPSAVGNVPSASAPASPAPSSAPSPSADVPTAPMTDLVTIGNLPTGAALSADGRFLWTVSAGFGANDVRIVDTATRKVCQIIPIAGASGGIALDSANHLAYVSGITVSRWRPSEDTLPGAKGNVVLVFDWTDTCGKATFNRVIPVPPPADAPTLQQFPPIPQRSVQPGSTNAWPQQVAVSPDGSKLLVALNLADNAAVVDLISNDKVTYVPMATSSYAFGATILPDSKTGLITNEATGKLSVIDLASAKLVTDIAVGPSLSHPQGMVVDAAGKRAYVALSASDLVVVVDLASRTVERTISVGRAAGLGTQPVALALDATGTRLFAVESGANEIAVIRVPSPTATSAANDEWQIIGRIPTAQTPQAVSIIPAAGGRSEQVAWTSARGINVGANATGPNPVLAADPIFWAFNPVVPTTDVFNGSVTYLASMLTGQAGFLDVPSDATMATLTKLADGTMDPANVVSGPSDTPLRADGPIKHVFFIVRENRSYDQLLGDLAIGNGDPSLSVFPQAATPNLHSLVTKFSLLDNVLANSEASIEGHYWTAAGEVPDYVNRNWVQEYAGRMRPNDFGMYAVTWPGNGFLFDQAERQGITYFNYGEAFDGGLTSDPDKNRSAAQLAELTKVSANSDLGVQMTPNGCYPSDASIGTALDNNAVFDASLPTGAPAGSYSHVDCFRARFAQQLAAGSVPALSYISLTSDHTRGTEPGFRVPTAMVADSDLALGQLVDTISHSSIWSSSAIFVVEDDSQDGADHFDAHRIPVAVISPYAKGGVVSTRYDLLSFVRSVELIIGMKPLTLNDALATPLYDAFSATPVNPDPISVLTPSVDMLEMNQPGAPWAQASKDLKLGNTDEASQVALDAILWHSVYGVDSVPPAPGPNAASAAQGQAETEPEAGD